MAPQCNSRRCWYSPWPLLGHQAELSWAEPAVQGTLVSLPTTEDPILQEPSRALLHQCSHGAFLGVGGLGWPGWSTGRRTGSCCCSCKSAISVGEARWSGPHRTDSVPDSSATLHVPSAPRQLLYAACPQCPQTAPLHCLPVGVWFFYFQSWSPAPAFAGEWGGELRGKQIGSMNEESQVRGCYNITFIRTPTNQETV